MVVGRRDGVLLWWGAAAALALAANRQKLEQAWFLGVRRTALGPSAVLRREIRGVDQKRAWSSASALELLKSTHSSAFITEIYL